MTCGELVASQSDHGLRVVRADVSSVETLDALRRYDVVVLSDTDLIFLRRCVELARQALHSGDAPFGSVLVSETGEVLAEDHNHTGGGDPTQHPEFGLARWSATHLGPTARAGATVYTSGEHCPMCSAAHALVGLGRIVYASSTEQLSGWLAEHRIERQSPVRPLPIHAVAPQLRVDGPADELVDEIRSLQLEFHGRRATEGPG